MPRHRITAHVRQKIVAYVALVVTLCGTSYAAAAVTTGSFETARDHNGRDRHGDRRGPDDGRGPDKGDGSDNGNGNGNGDGDPNAGDGPAGPTDPIGRVGGSSIGARARSTSAVVAKHGGSADIPLTDNTWTQGADELELLAGTVVISNPASCTGGFGNVLTLTVDGKAVTFAAAPAAFQAGTTTVPFLIGTLSEPGRDTTHTLTAKFANACTKGGEDFKVDNVQVDVLKFH